MKRESKKDKALERTLKTFSFGGSIWTTPQCFLPCVTVERETEGQEWMWVEHSYTHQCTHTDTSTTGCKLTVNFCSISQHPLAQKGACVGTFVCLCVCTWTHCVCALVDICTSIFVVMCVCVSVFMCMCISVFILCVWQCLHLYCVRDSLNFCVYVVCMCFVRCMHLCLDLCCVFMLCVAFRGMLRVWVHL